jgi:hypothetical protein
MSHLSIIPLGAVLTRPEPAHLPGALGCLPTGSRPRGVPEVSSSRRPLIFMDQSTEDVTAAQLIWGGRIRSMSPHRRHGRSVTEAAVRATLVVVLDVDAENANKLPAADDQQVVEALPPDRPDPTLGDSIGVGRPNRRADNLHIS